MRPRTDSHPALLARFAPDVAYYVKRLDGTNFKLASSLYNLRAGRYIAATTGGTGTITAKGGENANLYVEQARRNNFIESRFDQPYGRSALFG